MSEESKEKVPPERPAAPAPSSMVPAPAYNPYNNSYGNRYATSSFNSPYNSGYGGGMGYNRFGGSGYYGSFGSGGSYASPFGSAVGMNGPMMTDSVTQQMGQGTQEGFAMLGNIVRACLGFAEMLDRTLCATQSGFMAMAGLADQYTLVKNYFGQMFGIVAILGSAKSFIKRLLQVAGMLKVDTSELSVKGFEQFSLEKKNTETTKPVNRKPAIIFSLIIIGIPYLVSKLVTRMNRELVKAVQNPEQKQLNDASRNPEITPNAESILKKLDFAKVLYDFQAQSPAELSIKQGDVVAIKSKNDTLGQPSDWWLVYDRSKKEGFIPKNYVEIIQKKIQ